VISRCRSGAPQYGDRNPNQISHSNLPGLIEPISLAAKVCHEDGTNGLTRTIEKRRCFSAPELGILTSSMGHVDFQPAPARSIPTKTYAIVPTRTVPAFKIIPFMTAAVLLLLLTLTRTCFGCMKPCQSGGSLISGRQNQIDGGRRRCSRAASLSSISERCSGLNPSGCALAGFRAPADFVRRLCGCGFVDDRSFGIALSPGIDTRR
jgi:hypothetical protein